MDFVPENIEKLPRIWFSLVAVGDIPCNYDFDFGVSFVLKVE